MSKKYLFRLMVCIAVLINSLFGAVQAVPVVQAAETAKTGASDAAPITISALQTCPCTIFADTVVPGAGERNFSDGKPIEVGVKFRTDTNGYITGLRFYKGELNTGTHTGHLWDSAGNLLATATFINETASGWQTVSLSNPVSVTANTTYVASYFSDAAGYFALTNSYFTTAVNNAPLMAPAATVTDPNGVYRYTSAGFPDQAPGTPGANYWVDVVFDTVIPPDVTAPTVIDRLPVSGATGVNPYSTVKVKFSETINPATLTASTFVLKGPGDVVVPANISYLSSGSMAILDPNSQLGYNTVYTVTVVGGTNGVKDLAGNTLAANSSWTFRTMTAPPIPADEGPGGPILVVSNAANPFSRYYVEILKAEGLNSYKAIDITRVSATTLNSYSVVVLGEMSLTAAQVNMFTDWVNAGGNLIAMRPDAQLAGLLGLTGPSGTRSNAYLKIDTSKAPGQGLVSDTIQYHGDADLYTLTAASGAANVATLYSNSSTVTTNPAVTLRNMATGGQAAAFTYDLARSVVYTRQGNPAWAGQERDGQPTIRSDDLFYGGTVTDPQPDWVDLSKVAIPQADEQQRLLVNMIEKMMLDKMPLPHFWYLPRGAKAAVLMSGDDHNNIELDPISVSYTPDRFNAFIAASSPTCVADNWECIRASSHIYSKNSMTPAQAKAFTDMGFEVSMHVDFGCTDYTSDSVTGFYSSQLDAWKGIYNTLPNPSSSRSHCVVWSDWASQAKAELASGMRLDLNYYAWPQAWIQDLPGMFTGSGFPMRFADMDGTQINVYQAATQMTDESGQTYPNTIDTLLNRAVGPEGYYGVFTANIHSAIDEPTTTIVNSVVNSAKTRGVPVISGSQLLKWLDGRNNSYFTGLTWTPGSTDSTLTFSVNINASANGLQVLLPTKSATGTLTSLKLEGVDVPYTAQTIKGLEYAPFLAAAGTYTAVYTYQASMDQAPQVVNDTYTTEMNKTLTVPAYGVLNNDTEPNGTAFTAIKVGTTTPSHGTLTFNSNGSFTYVPANNYIGTDTFTYKANDGKSDSGNATVTINVTEVNVAPEAKADNYTVPEGGALNQAKTGGVLSNDTDANTKDTLTAVKVTDPTHGTLVLNADGSFTYTTNPAEPNYNGSDSFTYKVNDGKLDSNVATVVITISPVNDAPAAVNDSYTASEDVTLTVPSGTLVGVLANDTDVDTGTTLKAVKVTDPAHGTLTLNNDGSFTYTPTGEYSGPDSFTYKANDGTADSNVATVTLTVNAVNDVPVAFNDMYSVAEDASLTVPFDGVVGVLNNDKDVENLSLTAVKVTNPAHGTLTLNSNGSFTYTPEHDFAGTDTFTYKANDGTADSNTATVSITISPVNDVPMALVENYVTDEDITLIVPSGTLNGVLYNDTDIDTGTTLTAVKVTGPQHGSLALEADGSFKYIPADNYHGSDSFTYKAYDGQAYSNVVTVNISIDMIPDAPVAVADTHYTTLNTTLVVSAPGLLVNDYDGDTNPITAWKVSDPQHGKLTLNPDGSFTYIPDTGYDGADSFSYQVFDGTLYSDPITVTIIQSNSYLYMPALGNQK